MKKYLFILFFLSPLCNALDLVTAYSDNIYHTQNLRAMAKALKSDDVEITLHPAASLYKANEIYRAVRTGQVAMGEIFIGLLANQDPLYQLDNLPFLVENFEQAQQLWQLSRPLLAQKLIEDGLILLFAAPWPPQGLFSQKTINSIEDLKNSKMRAYSAITADLASLLGANPVSIQAAEITQAFSTGMIDNMFTSPSTGVSSRAWDFAQHYTDTQAWIPKNMLVINKAIFNDLSPAAKQSILLQAKEFERKAWLLAEQETAIKTAILVKNGMVVSKPTPRLESQLNQIGHSMLDDWLEISPQSSHDMIKHFLHKKTAMQSHD